jgi:hypothetical protein
MNYYPFAAGKGFLPFVEAESGDQTISQSDLSEEGKCGSTSTAMWGTLKTCLKVGTLKTCATVFSP